MYPGSMNMWYVLLTRGKPLPACKVHGEGLQINEGDSGRISIGASYSPSFICLIGERQDKLVASSELYPDNLPKVRVRFFSSLIDFLLSNFFCRFLGAIMYVSEHRKTMILLTKTMLAQRACIFHDAIKGFKNILS